MKILGMHEQRTIDQLARCIDAEEGSIGVLCADGHVGYSMPIGGVVGYMNHVSPSGVGYDIACGNLAVQTNIMAKDISPAEFEKLADEIQSRVSFGIGRKNNEPVDHPVLEEIRCAQVPEQAALVKLAADQLGTVGSGNHYVDVLEDEAGVLWVAVHFGSRGFGWKSAKGFMNIAQGHTFDSGAKFGEVVMDAPPLLLNIATVAGQSYIEAMNLAGKYAYAGREEVVKKVLNIIGAEAEFAVHNHHNFAWEENHDGRPYWVVRKGATPAFPGQFGFVGGSMGDISVILRGVDSLVSRDMLYSTVHGAGRIMSRTQAAGKQKWSKAKWTCGNCDFEVPAMMFDQDGKNRERPTCPKCGAKLNRQKAAPERVGKGLVDFAAEQAKLTQQGIVLRGAGADEAPPVYRRLESVLAAHADTIDIVHTLFPRIVVMAGGNEHDPYKD